MHEDNSTPHPRGTGEWRLLDEWQVALYVEPTAGDTSHDLVGRAHHQLVRLLAGIEAAERDRGVDIRITLSPAHHM